MKMTSKGTFTLPAKVRKDFGLTQAGDIVWLRHSSGSRHAEMDAPTTIDDLKAMREELSELIPPEIRQQPLDMNAVREQKHHEYLERNSRDSIT